MPDVNLSVQGTSDRVPRTGVVTIERGLLLSLCAWLGLGDVQRGQVLVIAGIRTQAQPSGVFHTVLINDYVAPYVQPAWDGQILLESGDQVQLTVISSETVIVRLTGRTIMQPFPVVTLEP